MLKFDVHRRIDFLRDERRMNVRNNIALQWMYFFIGLAICGFGIALTIKGQTLGVGSWDVLHIGLFKQLGLTIGLWSIILGILIVVISAIGLRQLPQIGTLANMIFFGLFIDLFNWLLPNPETFLIQVICFIICVITLAIGIGFYISADLGAGPRDTLMLLLVDKLNFSITASRTSMEVAVAVIGFFLGGPIGIGTVIIAFGLGPVIQVSLKFTKPLVQNAIRQKRRNAFES